MSLTLRFGEGSLCGLVDAASELLWLNLLATGQRTLSTAATDFLSSDEYWQAARSNVP